MTEPQKVHCYARIDRPYESVRSVLHGLLVEGATTAPVRVHSIRDDHDVAGLPAHTRATVGVRDEAPHESNQLISAEIYASALSPTETGIEVEGHCVDGERGLVNSAARAIAEAHVHSLLEGVVERIRRELERAPAPPASES